MSCEAINNEVSPDFESKSADECCQSALPLIEEKSKCENTFKNVFAPDRRNQTNHGMVICGHRGAGALEPENSMRAFLKAMELRLAVVEFDVSTLSRF
jgi:glycerophosphoryl diester phosphodiesterase